MERRKIIVVGSPENYHPSCHRWGDVGFSPPVYGLPSSPGLKSKQVNIEAAMFRAVLIARPGDLILQDDVDVYNDPWEPVDHDAIRTLVGVNLDWRIRGNHFCPQAFIFGKDAHHHLLSLWDPSRERPIGANACVSWKPIPKQADYIAAMHLPRVS